MNTEADDGVLLVETLAALRREVAALRERVAAVEQTIAAQATTATRAGGVVTPANAASGAVTPEIVAVISAVLAAYLGVKPHIRQISLAGGASWAQQGRVTIQASHALAIPRD